LNYTYTLGGVAVNPTGKWEIEYRKNKGQIFWRRHLAGELSFKGVDYFYITSVPSHTPCIEMEFIIYCDGDVFWTGIFKYPYSFTFDTDSCEAKGTPEVLDKYSCIMNKYEQEYLQNESGVGGCNIIDGSTANAVSFAGGNLPVNSRNLWEVFQDFINGSVCSDYMDCGLTCVSSFFNRDEFPGQTPGHYAGIYGTTNYVLDPIVYTDNELEEVYLSRNNIIRFTFGGTRCDGYDTETITFKFFEDLFRERFNAYWYIDEYGDLRIEHISFFLPEFPYSDFGPWIDLTQLLSNCQTFAYRRNKYKYLTEELFDQETWSWQHWEGEEEEIVHNVNFQGTPIYYGAALGTKSDCVPGEFKTKDSATPNIHSDYPWVSAQILALNPDVLGCPGFMLLHLHHVGPAYFMAGDDGAIDGVATANVFLSTANLQANFFTWERIFLTGVMNGSGVAPIIDFQSEIKKKLQNEIEFPLCCTDEFDPMKTIITEMGDGVVYSAVQTPYSVKIQLLYD
jgi:hypothetical protein